MEPNTETTATATAHDNVIARLENVAKSIGRIAQVTEAKTAAAPASDELAMKPVSETADDKRKVFISPLRKSFEDLATVHPAFHELGTAKNLDDPYSYLRGIPAAQMEKVLVGALASKSRQVGVPFSEWLSKSPETGRALERALSNGTFEGATAKALDSAAGGAGVALVRTDIEPILYEAYLREFPMLQRMRTFPSNGLVHTYDVRTGVGTAVLLNDMEDLVAAGADGTSTIVRSANANIATMATRRGISLKLRFAAAQSGMNWDLTGAENLEVTGGLTAIAKLNQKLIFQGNQSTSGGTLNNEDGLLEAKGFDGLRKLLKTGVPNKTWATGEKHYDNIDLLLADLTDNGARMDELVIACRSRAMHAFNQELLQFIRTLGGAQNTVGVAYNSTQGGFNAFGELLARYMRVPGAAQAEGIGYYDIASVAQEDSYILDMRGLGLAYLGTSAAPVVIEMPLAYDHKLGSQYVLFAMNGLVVNIPSFHAKYRIPKQ